MEASIRSKRMSVEEYIQYEERSDIRHEFDNGKLIAMAGTTDKHNDICHNIKAALKKQLKNTPCRIQVENVKVRLTEHKRYTYPDVFVTCDERDLADAYIKRYPSVVFEVLSDSTRVYDKTAKFMAYKKIDTIQHYILVEPDSIDIEIFSKNTDGEWSAQSFHTITDTLPIAALAINVPISEIYE
jgi:Uma2 family endonuclease